MLPPTAASVTSVNAPPLMFGEEISTTPPSQYVPSLNSVSKLFRNVSTGAPELTTPPARSSTLSLTVVVSLMNALLGAVSDPVVEVTQPGGGPDTAAVVQPGGNAGAVTPSKFSVHAPAGLGVGDAGGGVGLAGGGVGVLPGLGDAPGVGETPGVGVGTGGPPLPSPRS